MKEVCDCPFMSASDPLKGFDKYNAMVIAGSRV